MQILEKNLKINNVEPRHKTWEFVGDNGGGQAPPGDDTGECHEKGS
jgi:hypothetical protein